MPLTGREYPPEIVWNAQELYCVARLSYAELAAETGVGINTLKRWGQKYEWADKRGKIAKAECSIRGDMIQARSELLTQLIEKKDPMMGFAVAKLEQVALQQAEAARAGLILKERKDTPPREIHTQEDAADALEEAVTLKIQRLLTSPEDVDLKAVKNIKEAMALVAEMKPKNQDAAARTGSEGLSEATRRQIQKMLGYDA